MNFECRVIDGAIVGAETIRSYIASLKDGEYQISIRRAKRSTQQNNLYWSWLTVIGDDLGYRPNELHEVFIIRFASPVSFVDFEGKEQTRPQRTSEMSVDEMMNYMGAIQQFADEAGIILPTPEPPYLRNNPRVMKTQ